MKTVARVGDYHSGSCNHGEECCSHEVSGTILVGSDNVFANGKAVAMVGSTVSSNCPHCSTGVIVTGSTTVFVNGKPKARTGDSTEYSGGTGVVSDTNSSIIVG